ncbi:MAG: ATP-binding cassette domain-containing protein, partial [Actinobacteria bacterium]|nr:ATP-binding cassette domain-containing protein [Actinomycetota bacterium]
MPLLEFRGIKKRFGGNVVLDSIDLKVKKGEIRSIIGPNGAGKTTLFNLISGIYRPDAGEIL